MNIAGTTTSLVSSADNANAAPKFILNRDRGSGTVAANDIGGQIEFHQENNNNEQVVLGRINSQITTITDGSEAGQINISTMVGGTIFDGLSIAGTTTKLVSNDESAGQGPTLVLDRTTASPVDDDFGGAIEFKQENNNNEQVIMGRIRSQITTVADGSEDGKISFASTNGGTTTDVITVSGEGTENAVFPESNISFDFGVNGVRTDANKNHVLGAGVNRLWKCINSATACFGAQGNTEASSAIVFIDFASNGMILNSSISSPSSVTMLAFRTSGGSTSAGSISCSGSSTAYTTSSDYRIKENLVNLTGAIDRVKNFKTYRFNFKDNKSKTVDGFVAHEVASVVPEAVIGEKDAVDSNGNIDPQALDQAKLVPVLTAALQEAIAKIEVLETKVAALEAK
tara:strand:- start:196 stop:1392 length:1197 start_codon:yes stop_codon:yes gene_type:complete